MPNLGGNTEDYRGYTITSEGMGFYHARNPRGEQIAQGEGRWTMVKAIDDHIARVYAFWNLNCVLSPLQARAAKFITNDQAERIIADGGLDDPCGFC